MVLYLFVAVWPLIVYEIYIRYRLRVRNMVCSKEVYIILAMLPMFIMLGFRGPDMGADTGVYLKNFENTMNMSLSEAINSSRMETGYIIFVKFLGTYITKNPLVYQVICVSIYFVGLYSFLKEQEENDVFLFLYFFCTLGLFTFMFTGVRQCIAMSICLFSYKYVKKEKLLKFILCILLAYFFHKSALLFLAVYFISKRRITMYNVLVYGALVYLSTIYLELIQNWFNDQWEYEYSIESTGSGSVFLLILIILTLFSIACSYPLKSMNKNVLSLMNINFITLFFWILRIWTRVAERPSYYFLFFTCALIANRLNYIESGRKRTLYKFCIISFTLLLYVYRMKTNFSSLIPYDFY